MTAIITALIVATLAPITDLQPAERGNVQTVHISDPRPANWWTVPAPPKSARCPQWWPVAVAAGWPASDLERLDVIMWGELDVDPTVYNGRNKDQSYGIIQVNTRPGSGNRPFVGPLVGYDWARLFDPFTNLRVGRAMFELWEHRSYSGFCGWWGWTTRNRRWCS